MSYHSSNPFTQTQSINFNLTITGPLKLSHKSSNNLNWQLKLTQPRGLLPFVVKVLYLLIPKRTSAWRGMEKKLDSIKILIDKKKQKEFVRIVLKSFVVFFSV